MKITHIAQGDRDIPPKGWGAIEYLIDQHRRAQEAAGHEVQIINARDVPTIVMRANDFGPDVVHCWREHFFFALPYIKSARVKIAASYWPCMETDGQVHNSEWPKIYLDRRDEWFDPEDTYMPALCEWQWNLFRERAGIPRENLFKSRNSINPEDIRFTADAIHPVLSICLAAVQPRKRHRLIDGLDDITFAGPSHFDHGLKTPVEEWDKSRVCEHLTDFGNMVLLSQREVPPPLAIIEGLMAGLGLVISEACAGDWIDRSIRGITVIPESGVEDREQLKHEIWKNRLLADSGRDERRAYAIENFGMQAVTREYLDFFETRLRNRTAQSPAGSAP